MQENEEGSIESASSEAILSPLEDVKNPLLSIAIPTYKRFNLLKETLASVFILNFSFPVEILIVDNDPDQREHAVKEMELYKGKNFIYYKNSKNLGMFGNWNQCLVLAKGKYITILHDDDILLENFSIQMNRLLKNKLLPHEIVAFSVGLLDLRFDRPENKSSIGSKFKKILKKLFSSKNNLEKGALELFFSNPFCGTLGVVMNRSMALSLKGFNKDWYPVADYEFWCRWACRIGRILIVKERVGLYRLQENESLKLEVRKQFVTESTLLRRRMIAEKDVPSCLKYLVEVVASIQEKSINLDWRTRGESDNIFFRLVTLNLWKKLTAILCFLMHKTEQHKGAN